MDAGTRSDAIRNFHISYRISEWALSSFRVASSEERATSSYSRLFPVSQSFDTYLSPRRNQQMSQRAQTGFDQPANSSVFEAEEPQADSELLLRGEVFAFIHLVYCPISYVA